MPSRTHVVRRTHVYVSDGNERKWCWRHHRDVIKCQPWKWLADGCCFRKDYRKFQVVFFLFLTLELTCTFNLNTCTEIMFSLMHLTWFKIFNFVYLECSTWYGGITFLWSTLYIVFAARWKQRLHWNYASTNHGKRTDCGRCYDGTSIHCEIYSIYYIFPLNYQYCSHYYAPCQEGIFGQIPNINKIMEEL